MSSISDPFLLSSTSEAMIGIALSNYTRQTGIDLTNDPLTVQITNCDTRSAILDVLQGKAWDFEEVRNGDVKLIECLGPIIGGLHLLSAHAHHVPNDCATPAFAPAQTIFSGIGLFLAAAKSDSGSYGAFVGFFECIKGLLGGLVICAVTNPDLAMTETITKITAELLSILALATKRVNEGRFSNYAKQLDEESDFRLVLQRLARLTQEEARRTAGPILEVIYGLLSNMTVVMEGGNASIGSIRPALVSIHQSVNEVARVNRYQLQQDFHRWLSPPDSSTNYNVARKAHHSGTATWFTGSKIFQRWRSTGSLLWIHSKPGSGKSVLCSTIIHNVQLMREAGLATVGYYFADFRDSAKHSTRGLLSSMLIQLCVQSDDLCEILHSLYLKHAHGLHQPSDDALRGCLKEMLAVPVQGQFYIIVDALDEYPNFHGFPSPREQALEVMKDLVDLRLPHLHFCITSRPEMDIRASLAYSATYCVSLHDQIGQNKDIADYVKAVVHSDLTMRMWPEEDKKLVIETLTKNAGGMFRWAHCQLESLRRCPLQSIRKVLEELPKTLDETYERTLQGIDEEKWECAYRIFQFLTVAVRPLRVEELAEVFAIRADRETTGIPEFNARWRPANAEEAVLSACPSLVTITTNVNGEQIVQFSHFSVQEYLTGNRLASSTLSRYHVLPQHAHTFLAKACLSILLSMSLRIHKGSVKKMFPLVAYAAENWVGHAHRGDASCLADGGMERLFDENQPYFAAWLWVYDINNPFGRHMTHTHPEKPGVAPLYYAALCGFYSTVKCLVDAHSQDIDTRGGDGGTPLHAALRNDHSDIALFLLQRCAKADVKDSQHQTPLHIASQKGSTEAILSLITHGVDANAEDRENETPLSLASRHGRLEAIPLLFQHGADPNHQGSYGQAPLHVASTNGHHEVTRLLLNHGANSTVQDHQLQTPLHLASDLGCLAVAGLLLEHGAHVDAKDMRGWTPLHMASSGGQVEAARLLMDKGADLNAEDQDGWTALHLAAYNGHHRVVGLLLERGADHQTRNKEGNTPYEVVSGCNNAAQAEAAQLLLKYGKNGK